MRKQGGEPDGCHGHASRASDPDAQDSIDPLFRDAPNPAIALAEQERIVDAAREPRGKKEGHAQQGMGIGDCADWQRYADHEAVMQPVVEAEGLVIVEHVICVQGETELNGQPIGRIVGDIMQICERMNQIGQRHIDNERIMERMDSIVRFLETLQNRVHTCE